MGNWWGFTLTASQVDCTLRARWSLSEHHSLSLCWETSRSLTGRPGYRMISCISIKPWEKLLLKFLETKCALSSWTVRQLQLQQESSLISKNIIYRLHIRFATVSSPWIRSHPLSVSFLLWWRLQVYNRNWQTLCLMNQAAVKWGSPLKASKIQPCNHPSHVQPFLDELPRASFYVKLEQAKCDWAGPTVQKDPSTDTVVKATS